MVAARIGKIRIKVELKNRTEIFTKSKLKKYRKQRVLHKILSEQDEKGNNIIS